MGCSMNTISVAGEKFTMGPGAQEERDGGEARSDSTAVTIVAPLYVVSSNQLRK